MCFYSMLCSGEGLQTPVAGELGIIGGLGSGELETGQSDSVGAFYNFGNGAVAQAQFLTGPSGNSYDRQLVGRGVAGGGSGRLIVSSNIGM